MDNSAARFSKTLANNYLSTWRRIPKNVNPTLCKFKNTISQTFQNMCLSISKEDVTINTRVLMGR